MKKLRHTNSSVRQLIDVLVLVLLVVVVVVVAVVVVVVLLLLLPFLLLVLLFAARDLCNVYNPTEYHGISTSRVRFSAFIFVAFFDPCTA